MHDLFPSTPIRSKRALIFGLIFVALLALTGMMFSADQGMAAAPQAPLAPGETIPPGTLPPVDGPPLAGLINIFHLAPFDAVPANTAIVICRDADDAQVAGPISYGEQSGYMKLYLGVYDWYVATEAAGCGTPLLDLEPFTMFGGSNLTLIIYGGANGYPLESLLSVNVMGNQTQFSPIIRNQP